MPVRNSKREAGNAGDGMRQLAQPVVLARAAVPMAKTAGMAARDGARTVTVWVVPRVSGARAWTAPRIERGGLAVKDTIGPRIYEVLAATARRVDPAAPGADVPASRRTWPKVVAVTLMLVGGGAAAAVVARRRKDDKTAGAGKAADPDAGPRITQDGQPRASADGTASTDEDTSRQPPAT